MTIEATTYPSVARALVPGSLPEALRVLAVTARPGQESADLGGLLYAFRGSGASLSLLCLTRGEIEAANAGGPRVEAMRPWEVQTAALILGIHEVAVADFRIRSLHHYHQSDLSARIRRAIGESAADLVLIVAPETGDIADAAVARAVTAAAMQAEVPVAGHTRPGVSGSWMLDLGADAEIARAIQRSAISAHTSQPDAIPTLISRLDQLGRVEPVRWLAGPARIPEQPVRPLGPG